MCSCVPEYIGYVLVCATAVQSVCMCMNMHRHKAPCAYLQLPAVASSLCLRLWRSWGLTFHFSDPLFQGANGSAALEKCFATGGDTQRNKKKSQLQNNSLLLLQGYTSSLHLLHMDDITMILNHTVNKENQRTVLLRRCDSHENIHMKRSNNCFLLLPFWVWGDYMWLPRMTADWTSDPKLACVKTGHHNGSLVL